MASLTTPISDLLGKEVNDPVSQFAQMPQEQNRQMQQQITEETQIKQTINDIPTGPSQGLSAPLKATLGKEFFGIKASDYKTFILVFAILLIFTSSIFYSGLRPYIPSIIAPDGKITIVGSFIAAIVGTLVFILVKGLGKF